MSAALMNVRIPRIHVLEPRLPFMRHFRHQLVLSAAALSMVAACSSSDLPTQPGSEFSSIIVDASTHTSYVALGTTATTAVMNDPATSTLWDLGFTAGPEVIVNGGASGPAGVKAYCLCTNRNLTLAQVEALSATAGADEFGAVNASNIPSDASFIADTASQAIAGWYDYNTTTRTISTNNKTWGVRLASASGAFAKFHVTAIPSPGQSNAGAVTIQWATQASSSGAMGADRQTVVDLSSGAKVYVNLTTGATSTSSATSWDIALQNYSISVNGAAGAGAVALVPSSFYTSYASIASIPVGNAGVPLSAFAADGAGGAFVATPPYRYDPTSHVVYPTYDVYLVKRGTAVYKVQVSSYYGVSGTFGVLTLRYEKISG